MASFKAGRRLGADGLECDVRLSRDGQAVVFHDSRLNRLTGGRGPVKKFPWSALRRLDAGAGFSGRFAGERIPRLKDLLSWLKNKRSNSGRPLCLLIEIKNRPKEPGIARAVAREIQQSGLAPQIGVISFDHEVIRRMRSLVPSIFTGIIFDRPFRRLTERVIQSRTNAIFPSKSLATASLAKWARRRGVFLGVWTVNERREASKLKRAGIDALTTNFPDRF